MSLAPLRRLNHLGVNAVFLQPRMGGLETYVRQLLPALLKCRPDLRITVFVTPAGRDALATEPWVDNVELVTHWLLAMPFTKAISELTLVGRLAAAREVDLVHSVAMIGPIRPRMPSVVTIADVTWLRQPESVPSVTRLLWRTVVPLGARDAARVIAHSQAAAAEIAEDLEISRDRIDVVPHGPGALPETAPRPEDELRRRLGLGHGPILLAVSALSAHKNVDALIEAMPRLRRAFPDVVLVVPGNPRRRGEELVERARGLGVAEGIVFPGWVDAADLEGLYRAASCFVFPSFREGFGMPLLEAMARGVPIASSSSSALPEVAGDAALYFEPDRPAEIAEAIARILSDPNLARELTARGRERQRLFTWSRAAEKTLAVYERARSGW
jgi:glycosyltransferase involved in cell wall biosynthesis